MNERTTQLSWKSSFGHVMCWFPVLIWAFPVFAVHPSFRYLCLFPTITWLVSLVPPHPSLNLFSFLFSRYEKAFLSHSLANISLEWVLEYPTESLAWSEYPTCLYPLWDIFCYHEHWSLVCIFTSMWVSLFVLPFRILRTVFWYGVQCFSFQNKRV